MPRRRSHAVLIWAALLLPLALAFADAWTDYGREDALRTARRQEREAAVAAKGGRFLFLGDSVCVSMDAGSASDRRAGHLGALLKAQLLREDGPLRRLGWNIQVLCSAGLNGYAYDAEAAKQIGAGLAPALALLELNPRAYNRLGSNGFPETAPSLRPVAQAPGAPPLSAWRGLRQHWNASLRAALRSLQKDLVQPLQPRPQAAGPEAPKGPPPQGFSPVYGQGYQMDPRPLEGQLAAAQRLSLAGAQVLFYVTPVDRASIERQLGAGIRGQLDAGIAQAVRSLRAAGYPVLDLSQAFDGGFIDPPSEHLGAERRRELARRLAAWVESRLGRR